MQTQVEHFLQTFDYKHPSTSPKTEKPPTEPLSLIAAKKGKPCAVSKIEVEMKLRSTNTKNGIEPQYFFTALDRFEKVPSQLLFPVKALPVEETIDVFYKPNIRITNNKQGKTIANIRKTTLKSINLISNSNSFAAKQSFWKLVASHESPNDADEKIPIQISFSRKKIRKSFVNNDFQIDFTECIDNQNVKTYEIEIEWLCPIHQSDEKMVLVARTLTSIANYIQTLMIV